MTIIGFIGLGKIGMPIAKHLIGAGHELLGFKRSGIEAFAEIGGKPAATPREIGEAADLIFLCLPNDDALEAVVAGDDGLLNVARKGQIFVGLGSNPVPVKQRYADLFAEKGAVLLDGEVAGTPGMVAARKAGIFLAGDEAASETVRPVIEIFTENCLYLGAFGSATKIKLLNNLLVALNIAGAAQVVAIANKSGVDPEMMIDAVNKGSGSSSQFAIRAPWMAEKRFSPQQGSVHALSYYVREVKDMAQQAGVSTELIDGIMDIYEQAAPAIGDRDVAAILEYFEKPKKS